MVPVERIEQRIILVRGQKVMLDRDLAELYGVETKVLKQAVRRNIERFPGDFMFLLEREEIAILRSQFVTLRSENWGGSRYVPMAFTEQGVAMLSSVLKQTGGGGECRHYAHVRPVAENIGVARGTGSEAGRVGVEV